MNISMHSTKSYFVVWLAAAALAVALAVASPSESRVMGHLPAFMAHTLTRQPVAIPAGLPSDRTLALITFQREHRDQAESWIEGLDWKNDPSIAWMHMPIVNDPGTPTGRSVVEAKLLQRYPFDSERSQMVPVFTDRADFVRSVGLNGVGQSYAVVVNRQGDVLARVEGRFDAEKAKILRETLKATDF